MTAFIIGTGTLTLKGLAKFLYESPSSVYRQVKNGQVSILKDVVCDYYKKIEAQSKQIDALTNQVRELGGNPVIGYDSHLLPSPD